MELTHEEPLAETRRLRAALSETQAELQQLRATVGQTLRHLTERLQQFERHVGALESHRSGPSVSDPVPPVHAAASLETSSVPLGADRHSSLPENSGAGGGVLDSIVSGCEMGGKVWDEHMGTATCCLGTKANMILAGDNISHVVGGGKLDFVFDPLGIAEAQTAKNLWPELQDTATIMKLMAGIIGATGSTAIVLGARNAIWYPFGTLSIDVSDGHKLTITASDTAANDYGGCIKIFACLTVLAIVTFDVLTLVFGTTKSTPAPEWFTRYLFPSFNLFISRLQALWILFEKLRWAMHTAEQGHSAADHLYHTAYGTYPTHQVRNECRAAALAAQRADALAAQQAAALAAQQAPVAKTVAAASAEQALSTGARVAALHSFGGY